MKLYRSTPRTRLAMISGSAWSLFPTHPAPEGSPLPPAWTWPGRVRLLSPSAIYTWDPDERGRDEAAAGGGQ